MLLLGFAGSVLLASYAARRASRERRYDGEVSARAAAAAWLSYAGHAAFTARAAQHYEWPLPLDRTAALGAGGVLAACGGVLYALGTRELASLARMSGTTTDELVTSGIFRYSRNPQYAGWGLVLLGASLAGRSGLALFGTAAYGVGVHALVVRVEEPHLAHMFGERFLQYRAHTPRYFGLPRAQQVDEVDGGPGIFLEHSEGVAHRPPTPYP